MTDTEPAGPPIAWQADADEMARAAAGDEAAFRRLYDAHHGRVVRLAYGVLQDREEARDIAHDVMLQLLKTARRWEPRASLSTWLRAVTLRACFSWRRRLRVRVAKRADVDPPAHLAPRSADAAAAAAAERRALRRAMAALGPRDRAILVLHVDEDLDPREIAAALGLSDNAARVALHRALARVKEALSSSSHAQSQKEAAHV